MAVRYEIYGKDTCVFCDRAVALLKSYGRPYVEIKIDTDISMDDFRVKFPTARTVPQILLGDLHIGGYSELERHCRETW